MAITDIQATVSKLTGATPAANTVEDAQKTVVTSVPKNLMWSYTTETNSEDTSAVAPTEYATDASGTKVTKTSHGLSYHDVVTIVGCSTSSYNGTWKIFGVTTNDFLIEVTFVDNAITKGTYSRVARFNGDAILSVRRGNYEVDAVSPSLRGFLIDSSSLHYPSNTFPKYYVDKGAVVIKPSPSGNNGYVTYVDYSKIDDESDLRTSVIYIAASIEFTRLATAQLPSWVGAVPPSAPSQPSFTYTPASVSDITQPILSILDKTALTASAPTYTAPVVAPDFDDASTKWINTEEDPEMVASRVQVINSQITEFQAKSADALNTFNAANAQYQEDVQRKTENLQKDMQVAIQNATNELQTKSANVGKDVQLALQNAMQSLQTEVQEYTAKVQLYQSDLQNYGAQVQEQVQEFQSKALKANYYGQQAEKYYAWGKQEALNYIQYNSKTMGQMAAQQQQRSR